MLFLSTLLVFPLFVAPSKVIGVCEQHRFQCVDDFLLFHQFRRCGTTCLQSADMNMVKTK
ncbi:unnamed protein product, partial [Amoebophrya sp. A120]|eukprot:GSA120T00011109001.1